MDKRFLAPLLILVFLSFLASSIPIAMVRASPDTTYLVTFIALDQSVNQLPNEGCKWHIICLTNHTGGRTFSGNPRNLKVTAGDSYDVRVSWQGSFVTSNMTYTGSSLFQFVVITKVTDVVFAANDHDGNPLYDGPCYWNITYPVGNATTRSYNWASGTLKLGNGTYWLKVMWQGTYVTENTSWTKDVETSKSMPCKVVDRTFVAETDGGQQLWPGATRIWVNAPNGTWYTSPTNSSSFTIEKLSYDSKPCIIKVRFENTKVFEETKYFSDLDSSTYEAECDVYQYTPRLLDQEGRFYQGAEIHLLCPNGTSKTLRTDGNGRVSIPQIQKGSYSIPEVIYNGHKVNQTAPFLIEGNLPDWTIQFNGLFINQTDYPGSVHLNSTFTIKAKLVYSYSGKPIKGGKVGLLGTSWLNATTDASGWATFSGLSEWQPTGPFTVFGINDTTGFGLTYSVQNKTVAVTWTGDIKVQALDAKGSALNHASVLVSNETGGYWKTVYTDSTGLANVNGVPCQGYAIAVEWKGVEVGDTTINLNRAKMSETISCTVYYWDIKVGNLDGTAISGASVTVYRPDGTVYGTYKTTGTGYIPQIEQIPKETYRVKVDYTGAIFGATINLNQNLETQLLIAVVSCPDVPNVGKLCYSTSSNVSSITYNGTFKELRIELSGPTGTSGSVSVFVPRTLLGNLSLTVENIHTFLDSEPVNATIEDHPDGYLVIVSYTHSSHIVEVVFSDITLITTVKDSNNRAINGANVKLYREGALVEEGYADEAGEAVFTNLATGEYEIKTFHLGVLVKTDQVTLLEDLDYRAYCPVYDLTIQVFDMIPSPLPGASVTASLQDGRVLFSGTTNGAGGLTFLQVPAEDYKIKATYFGISGSTDVVIDRNLTIQIHVPMLNMTTIVLLLTAVGAALTLMGTYLSKRVGEKPKRGRGRPRKVRMPT